MQQNDDNDAIIHRIGIISDTHGLLRPQILEILSGCDAILHSGDINNKKVLEILNKTAPVYAVRGNADGEWGKDLPETLSLKLFGIKFFIIHNKKNIPDEIPDTDIVVYGHSHKYEEKNVNGRLYLNPGSCGPRRFTLPVTMAVLEISQTGYSVKKTEISQSTAKHSESGLPKNLKQVINCVIKDTNRGIPVKEIAVRNGIEEKLAEQICRLYLTHPGVDADGIMVKMGL